jgi:putative restriction endonuclease
MPVNQYERAFRAWPILIGVAAKKDTITYGDLADRLGIHPRPIRFVLGKIQDYCLDAKLPPLTIVVVSQHGQHPGTGFVAWDSDNWTQGLRQVHEYPWHERVNPFMLAADGTTLEQLAQRLVAEPDEAAVIYGRIRDRGYAQVVFRLALLHAYEGRCAFCGLSLRAALQAAHIIPWGKATVAQRMDPSNGLLLCSTHHALFDAHLLAVRTNRSIVCRLETLPRHVWTEADRSAAIALHGKPLSLPTDERLRPSKAALAYRANL